MFDIQPVLDSLFRKNKIFSSEAHFQLELAWMIKELDLGYDVRLEYVPYGYDDSMHVDIVLFEDCDDIPSVFIELKYTTKAIDSTSECKVKLKDQGAQDCRRYDFIKDIKRLEGLTASFPGTKGYAVFLTNDPLIWKQPSKTGTCDAAFRIHDGKVLSGELDWNINTSEGTKKCREQPLNLRGRYLMEWKDYMPSGVQFKYSFVEVKSKSD